MSADPIRHVLDPSLGEPDATGTVRVVSLGSVWLFHKTSSADLAGPHRYLRMPRDETGREWPEWGDERAGPCQDFVWHDLYDAWITDDRKRLIVIPADSYAFWGPMTAAGDTFVFDLDAELARHGYLIEPWRAR